MQSLPGKPVLSSQLLRQACLFTGSATRAIDCQSSAATAPRCWHLKTYLLSCGFSNHTRQQGGEGTRLPHQQLSMKSSRSAVPHSMLAFFWLRSTDQNLAQSGCPARCNERLCPAMTNGPSEIVTSPASEMLLRCLQHTKSLLAHCKNSSTTLAGATCVVILDSWTPWYKCKTGACTAIKSPFKCTNKLRRCLCS